MDSQSKNSVSSSPVNSTDLGTESLPGLKQSSRKKKFGILFLLLALVASAGVAGYVYMQQNAKPTKSSPVATHFSSPDDLVSQATTSDLKGKVLNAATTTSLGGLNAAGFSTYSFPPYKVGSNDFENFPTSGTGAGYLTNSVAATSNYQQFVDFFESNHFTKISSSNGTGRISLSDEVNIVSYAVYGSNEMLCSIWHADASATQLKQHVASIGCASKDNYKKAADLIKPFYAIYTKNNATLKGLVFGVPTISDGKNGYKNAVVYQEDYNDYGTDGTNQTDLLFNGYYYLAPGSNDWSFFAGLDPRKTIYCNEFDTTVLKEAFNGLGCYDTTTDKVVPVTS